MQMYAVCVSPCMSVVLRKRCTQFLLPDSGLTCIPGSQGDDKEDKEEIARSASNASTTTAVRPRNGTCMWALTLAKRINVSRT